MVYSEDKKKGGDCVNTNRNMSEPDLPEMHDFGKTLFSLALPVILQSLLSAAVNYADVWMLSCIHQNVMSAVSQANQITFLLTLIYLGLSTGVSILTSQYWGVKNTDAIAQILGLGLKLSMLSSVAFFLLTLLIPNTLMGLYSSDPVLISYGIRYLRIIGLSYLATGISQMVLASMKSMEQTKTASFISSGGLFCNIALNGVSIFILFPHDPMRALMGVAWATVAARVLETGLCLHWLKKNLPVTLFHANKTLQKDFARCTVQVQLNYLIWGGALSAISALIGHVSTDMVSAYTLANSVRNLAIVLCTGASTAGGILLGKALGAGQLALAKAIGDRLTFWSLVLGAVSGILVLLLRGICLDMVSFTPEAEALLQPMLLICALYCIGKSFNSTLVGGIFCAGGDTRFGLICDTIAMWGVILPLGWLSAFHWNLPPILIFLVLSLDEFVKMPFVWAHYKQYRWLNNLTHTTYQEES